MKYIRTTLTICLLLLCCAGSLLAQSAVSGVPGEVKFSGALSDTNGKPLTGTVGVTFLLYSEPSGGAPLWMETQNVHADQTGHYSVVLGSATRGGVPASAFVAGEARWLAIQPDGQTEQPRVELVSVPYALKAADAETLGGLPASAFLRSAAPTIMVGDQTSANTASSSKPAAAETVSTAGGTARALAKFDSAADIASSQIVDDGANVGIGTTAPAAKLDVKGSGIFRGVLTLPAIATATSTAGKNSQPLNLAASAFSANTSKAVSETFRWQAEPVGNNTAAPSGKLNLLFSAGTVAPAETGLSISSKGIINFASGQTFPSIGGNGTVKSVGLSAPTSDFSVSGSPVTGSGTLNLQWLVSPTSGNVANAIVKRDPSGSFSTTGITVIGGSVQVIGAGEGVGAVSTANLPETAAISGRAAATGEGSTHGVNGFSSTTHGAGMFGLSDGTFGAGVFGQDEVSGTGVLGQATGTSGQGVFGESLGSQVSGNGFGPDGVDGVTHSTAGAGVGAVNTTSGVALFAQSNGGNAGLFLGDVDITGTVSKGAGSFKIDDPLDPANKYLYHSFVESPDMMNVYNGNLTTNAQGEAVVEMPKWFEALNRDFRYQLTVIGQFAQAIVASEMANNTFSIQTDKPNVKVSWQITGIRHDAFANAHRIPVEEAKPEKERGLYLHPELFGAPAEKSIMGVRYPATSKLVKEGKSELNQ